MKAVKSAYRKRALKCHPDKGGSKQEFQKIQEHLGKITVAIGELLRKYPNVTNAREPTTADQPTRAEAEAAQAASL